MKGVILSRQPTADSRQWHLARSILSVLLAVGCWLSADYAYAQTQQDIEKQVSRMNKKAMEDYDSLEFESARKTLIDAVAILRANGYDETPLAAKTYVNLGMIYIAGFKDRNRGVQQFVNALKIKPDTRLDPMLSTPELEEAFAAAQKQVGVKGQPKPPTGNEPKPPTGNEPTPPTGTEPKGLVHNPVDEARPNQPIPIRAQLGTDTGATRVYLFFRGGGQEDYVSEPMKQQGADWVGVIPGEAVTGRALQYYLEARDARGRPVVGSGSAPNPYIITINENAAPLGNVPEIDVEDPLAKERERKKKAEEERKRNKRQHVFIFVMPGFGFGFEPAGNHTEVAWDFNSQSMLYQQQPIVAGGAAIAPFHIGIEIGYFISNAFQISIVGRFQVLTGANAETQMVNAAGGGPTSKATGAIAGLLRARYRFLSGAFHPYVHVDIGAGQIRHALDISSPVADQLVDANSALRWNTQNDMSVRDPMNPTAQYVCPSKTNCVDSIALGLVLLGGGAGIWYDVHKNVGLILDINLLGAIGTGDSQSGLNVDIQAGVGAHF